jgi:hypothetical protein
VERYLGTVVRDLVWDRLLREYYAERVVVDIAVRASPSGRTWAPRMSRRTKARHAAAFAMPPEHCRHRLARLLRLDFYRPQSSSWHQMGRAATRRNGRSGTASKAFQPPS